MWELRVLGGSDLRHLQDGERTALHLQPKRFALLCYLALASARTGSRRDAVLLRFWPDVGEEQARNALNQSLHQLREALGADVIISRGAGELVVSRDRLWCDANAFEQTRLAGNHVAALELYRGDLLDGLHVPGSVEFEYWLEDERRRLRGLAADSARELATAAEKQSDNAEAARWFRRVLEIEAYDEHALRGMVDALERGGDRASALRAYEDFAQRLRRELDVEPDPETAALATWLRSAAADAPRLRGNSRISLAVLPFANLSGDPEQLYFCEGMADAISNALAQVDGFAAVARSSVRALVRQGVGVEEIGRRLRVTHVLEGSVRRFGNRIRITAQLIRVPGGLQISSREYEREFHDVFAVQTDVAQHVARQLRGALEGSQPVALAMTRDPHAYDLYLRGKYLLGTREPGNLESAVRLLAEAAGRDPGFAHAHAALGEAHGLRAAVFQDMVPSRVCIPLAKMALEAALRADPRQAEAHGMLGILLALHEWDWASAEDAVRRACELAPGNGRVHLCRSTVLLYGGRTADAVAASAQAVRLEPFVLSFRETHGICLFLDRRYQEAIASLRETLELDPRLYVANVMLGEALAGLGRFSEAAASYGQVIARMGRRPYPLAMLACLHARTGNVAAAHAIIAELERGDYYVRPTYLAQVHAALGNHTRALELLEAARDERDLHLPCINVDPRFDRLRADPRFAALARTVDSLR